MAGKQFSLNPVIGSLLKTVLWPISRARLPQTSGRMRVQGLKDSVEVLRDRWGVAHIYGKHTEDVLFGQGFVHAQERLWQMDFTRRVVFGRLAEVIGEAALPFDRAMRTVGLYRTAEQEARKMTASLGTLWEAYCAGANAWIETAKARRKLPVEFMLLGYQPEPWRLADILSWGKLMCWVLACNWQSEFTRGEILNRLGPEKTSELEIDIDRAWAVILDLGLGLAGKRAADATRLFTGPRTGEGIGSNNWVVHGSRTTTGMPLLANDMHLELSTPAVWFENHLSGGELEATGVTMPGVPLIISGHNRFVAWGYTDSCADVQDLYEEHLRRTAEDGWEYEFKGRWLPVEVRREEILIKGGKRTVEEVLVTRHGPIINPLFKEAFPEAAPKALRWTALDPDDTFQAIYDMNVARDCREFHEALRHFDNPSQNVVYADTQGNIAYTMNGKIPIRAKGDGTVPAPGWTGEYEWSGCIPFDELPHLFNPPSGYIATANNQINRPEYPHNLGKDFLVSERAGRIVELLEAREKVDIAYFQKMQFDQVAFSGRVMAGYLGALHSDDPELCAIIEQMRGWDGSLDARSPLAAVHEATIRRAGQLVLEHQLGELGLRIQGRGPFAGQWPEHTWEWFLRLLEKPDSAWFDLGNGERREDVLRLALRQALDFLKAEFGPQMKKWEWGKLHKLTFGHVLGKQKPLDGVFNLGPFPIGGDGATIWATYSVWHDLDPRVLAGPPFRFVADLGDLNRCWALLAPGQSGHLASPHYKDGVKPWFEGGYHPILFRRVEVERNLESRLKLDPVP
jgi:penicillin amidase